MVINMKGDNTQINAVLGERVRALRIEKRITREALAERIDVSARFLADVETGKVGVSLTTLKKLCLTLNTCADHLLGISELSDKELLLTEIDSKVKKIDRKYLIDLIRVIDAFSDAVVK